MLQKMRDFTRKEAEFREWGPIWRQLPYWTSEVCWEDSWSACCYEEDSTRDMKEKKRNEQSIQEHKVCSWHKKCRMWGGGTLPLPWTIRISGSWENKSRILRYRNGPAKGILRKRWRCELISDQDKGPPYFLPHHCNQIKRIRPAWFHLSPMRRGCTVISVTTVKISR
jgi:hypothetical protein